MTSFCTNSTRSTTNLVTLVKADGEGEGGEEKIPEFLVHPVQVELLAHAQISGEGEC